MKRTAEAGGVRLLTAQALEDVDRVTSGGDGLVEVPGVGAQGGQVVERGGESGFFVGVLGGQPLTDRDGAPHRRQ